MIIPKHVFAVILSLFFLGMNVEALEVIKVKGSSVLIRLDGGKVNAGDRFDLVDSSGAKKGIVKITKFNGTKAAAKIEAGSAEVGMKLQKRSDDSDVSIDSEVSSPNSYNVRVNPLGLLLGAVDLALDIKVADDWTVGPQGSYWRFNLASSGIYTSDYEVTAYGIGARANWFYNGVFKDGFYLGPALEYMNVSVKTTDAIGSVTGSVSGLMASCLAGYGWFWNNFNIMLGGGLDTTIGTANLTIKDSAGNQSSISTRLTGLALEFSLGYAF